MVVSIGILNFGLWGCEGEKTPTTPATQPSAAASTGEQKLCPLSDHEISPKSFVEYKGKKVYFCCDDCKEPFQKEPEKYTAKLPQFGGKEGTSKGKM
jgi:YHS domain-containing protein